jgi:CubicO group peptidase (beta-lactamase class C family)
VTRRTRLIVLGVAAAAILSAATSPERGHADDVACDPKGCISISAMAAHITAALHNRVVGFVALVGGLAPALEGQARTAADPPRTAMLPDLPVNVASVSKVLTTVAIVQSLRRNHLTLDSKIGPYLYKNWTRGPNIDAITFRMLLSHAAGFRADCRTPTYGVLQAQIARGVRTDDMVDAGGHPVRSYNNCNFAIFRELLPQMEGVSVPGPTDGLRARQSAAFYIRYMNRHVFRPVGLPDRACRAPINGNDIPGYRVPPVLTYPYPPGRSHGTDWGDWTLACGGGGGWMLSPADVFEVMKDLATGSALLTKSEKAELMASAPNCIGWDCSLRSDCPDPSVCKDGLLRSGALTLHTYAGILKCNVPVVVVVNSVLPEVYEKGRGIIGLVHDAQTAAMTEGSGRPCP